MFSVYSWIVDPGNGEGEVDDDEHEDKVMVPECSIYRKIYRILFSSGSVMRFFIAVTS